MRSQPLKSVTAAPLEFSLTLRSLARHEAASSGLAAIRRRTTNRIIQRHDGRLRQSASRSLLLPAKTGDRLTAARGGDSLARRVEEVAMSEKEVDTDRVDEAVLALLYLGLHDEDRSLGIVRSWKSFDWNWRIAWLLPVAREPPTRAGR